MKIINENEKPDKYNKPRGVLKGSSNLSVDKIQLMVALRTSVFLNQTKYNQIREFRLNKNRLTLICNQCYLKCSGGYFSYLKI